MTSDLSESTISSESDKRPSCWLIMAYRSNKSMCWAANHQWMIAA